MASIYFHDHADQARLGSAAFVLAMKTQKW
jgi:hypothetical protein